MIRDVAFAVTVAVVDLVMSAALLVAGWWV